MCQSYSSSVTPSLVSRVLEARPISASRQKTVIWGPSWISGWALLTNTAIDHQWLEEGEEPSLSKFAPRDHRLRPEMPPTTRNCRKKGADPGAASQPQPGADDWARARAAKSGKSPDCCGSKLYRYWGNYKWNHWRQHWQDSTAGWPSWDILNITIAGGKQSPRR